MLSQFKKVFTKSKPKLKRGDVWYCESDKDNPFRKRINYVRIKDVRDGWVNYSVGLSGKGPFQDEVMKESEFRKVYPNKVEK